MERRAFESFLRHGRVPGIEAQLAEARALSLKASDNPRPTGYYTWRTAHDRYVRQSHAANEGRVFSWDDPPTTGHPGKAHNCRCWAEPYYGTPGVPDASLKLERETRTDPSGKQRWQHIDKLSRPDGSIAKSTILLRNGTRIASTFAGQNVTHRVHVPGYRQHMRVEKQGRFQAFYLGERSDSIVRSPGSLNERLTPATSPGARTDETTIFDQLLIGPSAKDAALGLLFFEVMIALYNAMNAEPEGMGAGEDDLPVLVMRAWQTDGTPIAGPISRATIALEDVPKYCERLPDVQTWTDMAAALYGPEREKLGPAAYGSKVHASIKATIVELKRGPDYDDLEAEFSLVEGQKVSYGAAGSTRLDILEDRREELGYVCVYDIKTGNAELKLARINQIAETVFKYYGPATFIVLEVKPNL